MSLSSELAFSYNNMHAAYVCLEYGGSLPIGGCLQPGGCDTWSDTGVKLCYDDYIHVSEYIDNRFTQLHT